MISSAELDFAEHIVESSDAVRILADGVQGVRGPQPDRQHLKLLLIGLFLAIRHHGRGTVLEAHRVLTQRIPRSAQLRLGITTTSPTGIPQVITTDMLFRWTKRLSERLGYTTASHPELDDNERQRRQQVIRKYSDSMMDVFNFATGSNTYALDATGLHAWSVARRTPKNTTPTTQDTSRQRDFRRGTMAFDPDPAWGYRTGRNGENSIFFGFHEHTLVQVPDVNHQHKDIEPRLIRRFEITAANADVVQPSLSLIDRLTQPITDLIVDSHYHFKSFDRWKQELDQRNIRQHHDLRTDETSFVEYDRLRWVGGYAHCPATPDTLDRLNRPNFDANAETREAFYQKFETRERWALVRHTQPDLNGSQRLVCPALAGKIGCPLRAGTVPVALTNGLPIVDDPPTATPGGEPLPRCCTQQTMKTSPPEKIFKLDQPHYWGSKRWDLIWRHRTYVEGSYGNRKNVSNENMRRGITRIPGLAFLHITIGLVNASYNLRMVRNWHERTNLGDPSHPLLAPDSGPGEWDFIKHESPDAA